MTNKNLFNFESYSQILVKIANTNNILQVISIFLKYPPLKLRCTHTDMGIICIYNILKNGRVNTGDLTSCKRLILIQSTLKKKTKNTHKKVEWWKVRGMLHAETKLQKPH